MLWQKGAWMDPDLNKYDLEHVTAHHPKMTKGALLNFGWVKPRGD